MVGEDAHPAVCQGVHEVQSGHEEVGNAQKEHVAVLHVLSAVPHDEKDGQRHTDAGKLCQAMEQQKTVHAEGIQAGQGDHPGGDRDRRFHCCRTMVLPIHDRSYISTGNIGGGLMTRNAGHLRRAM